MKAHAIQKDKVPWMKFLKYRSPNEVPMILKPVNYRKSHLLRTHPMYMATSINTLVQEQKKRRHTEVMLHSSSEIQLGTFCQSLDQGSFLLIVYYTIYSSS